MGRKSFNLGISKAYVEFRVEYRRSTGSAVFLYWLARLKSGFLLFRDKSSDCDFKKKNQKSENFREKKKVNIGKT